VTLGAFAAGLIAGAGNVHNDICDIEIDKINRPQRPLPRQAVSVKSAAIFSLSLATMGNLIGLCLGTFPFFITLLATFLLFAYNSRWKMTPLWGNIVISLLTALAFIFGAILAGNIIGGVIPAIFSLLFHFSREMVKDMEDYGGDFARKGTTFAQKYGLLKAGNIAIWSLTLLFIVVPIPYFAKVYKIHYFIISLIGVEIPLLLVMIQLLRKNYSKLRPISQVLKLGMVLGLIALLVGR
jgi:geranylgeranylglycerol-phosphate geranylgeranyltransferase